MLRYTPSNDQYPPGLYLGQAGIAWVLAELGHIDVARHVMRAASQHELLWSSHDLVRGASGYGLACLKMWTLGCGQEFLDEGVRVGQRLLESCVRDDRGVRWPEKGGTVRLGYAYGGSGTAMLLLYLHMATGDPKFLEQGRQALDFELDQGVWLNGRFAGFPDLALDEPESAPELRCYWDAGSAGVGTTLVRYLAVTADTALERQLTDLVSDASRKYTVSPQLFHGLAGLGNFLLDVWEQSGDERHLAEAWQVAEGVLLFRIERAEGIVFPGEQAARESADFATGAAGVGLFLHRLLQAEHGIQGNFNFVIDELLATRQAAEPVE
jgi:lantibiotic modifying enzyme